MGYELAETVYVVRLRGTQYDGVEVRLSGCSVGDMILCQRSDAKLLATFAEHLLSWNLTHNDEPIPLPGDDKARAETVLEQDSKLILSLALGWLDEQRKPVRDTPIQPPAPSMNGSGDLAMETL